MYRTRILLKNISTRTGEGKIVIEITFQQHSIRERVYIPTKEKILAEQWKNGKVLKSNVHARDILSRVEIVHNEVKQLLFQLEKNIGYVNATVLKNHLNKENDADKDILTLFDEFIELKRLTAKSKMVIKLHTLRNHLKRFLNNKKMYLVDYDQSFINKLTYYWQEEIGLQPNTIHKLFKFFLLFLNHLKRQEVILTDKYKKLDYPRQVETNTVVLHKEEVKKIIQYHPENGRLKRVKDLFLILVFTGLRFGDGVRISKRWVYNETLYIHTEKTDEKISIPIHPILKNVLEEYNYQLSTLKISNQKFNAYIKEVCQNAGITDEVEIVKYKGKDKFYLRLPKYKLISSHTGRRTFITNAIVAGIPLSVIQKITGHKKLTTLQQYVDIADAIKVKEMRKLSKYYMDN